MYVNLYFNYNLDLKQVIKLPIYNNSSKEYIELKENISKKIKLPDLADKKENHGRE